MTRSSALSVSCRRKVGREATSVVAGSHAPCGFSRREVTGRQIAQPYGESRFNVCTSIVVAAELWYGATKKDAPRLTNQLEAVLGVMEVLPLALPVDCEYGRLHARLERDGQPIGGNDLLREFSRIAKLSCENWLR